MNAAAVGRPVLHASISGITAVIDADGDIRRTTQLFRNEVVSGDVTTVRGDTLYVRFGDWVVWGSLLGIAGAVVLALTRRRLDPSEPQTAGANRD
jgi:apolipoprotein N-acyltransferase